MKKMIAVLFAVVCMSALSGYMLSKASWIGKVGMTFFYKEYNMLKIWWQGGTAVLLFILFLFFIHYIVHTRLHIVLARVIHFFMLAAAVIALYFTVIDFSENISHRILGRRFHIGVYLVWAQWIMVSLFFMLKKKHVPLQSITPGKTEIAAI